METWKDRARLRMKELGTTQEALAEVFDMTTAGMQKWLAGTRQPSLDEINRIADHLKVPRTWLTHGLQTDATIDGLDAIAQATLRKLIELERSGPLPATFWGAVESMAQAVTNPTLSGSASAARDGTEG